MPEDIQNNFDIKLNAQIARINGSPFSWFEDIYSDANGNSSNIPWAALSPNTNMYIIY